jgi:hypothetical protein
MGPAIGGNGRTETHVIRMRSARVGSSRSCRLHAKSGQIHRKLVISHLEIFSTGASFDESVGPGIASMFQLPRSRTHGATCTWASADAPRRSWKAPSEIPGSGKGLNRTVTEYDLRARGGALQTDEPRIRPGSECQPGFTGSGERSSGGF